MLALLLNFIEDTFVNSYESYMQSLRFLEKSGAKAMKFGQRTFGSDTYFTKNWKHFIESYSEFRDKLYERGIPSGKTIPQLVEKLRWRNNE
jgi:hypothetical protein